MGYGENNMIKVLIRYWFASLNKRALEYQIKKLQEYSNSDHEDTYMGSRMALIKLGAEVE